MTGHAVVANFILERINEVLGYDAPKLDLASILATDPYCDQDLDGWVPGPDYEPSGITRLLFLFRDPDDSDPGIGVDLPTDVWDEISDVLIGEILGVPVVHAEAVRLGIIRPDASID